MSGFSGKAPRNITWVVCLILYLIAVANYFGVIHIDGKLATFSWIVGFALLLLAVKVKGL